MEKDSYLIIISFTSVKLNLSLSTELHTKIGSFKNKHFQIDSSRSVELSCGLIKKREVQNFLELPHFHCITSMFFNNKTAGAEDATK